MTPAEVVARRRAARRALLSEARAYAAALDPGLDVRAVVVFGSVARGDFNAGSDIDVLIVAEGLPEGPVACMAALGPLPGGVEPIAWSLRDWRVQCARRDPIAVEALVHGVWLSGTPDVLVADRSADLGALG